MAAEAGSWAAARRTAVAKSRQVARRLAVLTRLSADKQGRGNQSLRPVTVKQINEASQTHPDSDYQIDGHDINQVSR